MTFNIDLGHLQRIVGWRVCDGNGNIVKRFEVDFDYQDLEIEKRQYGPNGKLERLRRYIYDDNNRRLEEQHFDGTGTVVTLTLCIDEDCAGGPNSAFRIVCGE